MRIIRILNTIIFVIFLVASFPSRVEAAYIDPNTGGMLFQAAAAAFAAISGLILVFSSRIRMAINRLRRRLRDRGSRRGIPETVSEKSSSD